VVVVVVVVVLAAAAGPVCTVLTSSALQCSACCFIDLRSSLISRYLPDSEGRFEWRYISKCMKIMNMLQHVFEVLSVRV